MNKLIPTWDGNKVQWEIEGDSFEMEVKEMEKIIADGTCNIMKAVANENWYMCSMIGAMTNAELVSKVREYKDNKLMGVVGSYD